MDKAKTIKNYQYFFDDQIREIEAEQKNSGKYAHSTASQKGGIVLWLR